MLTERSHEAERPESRTTDGNEPPAPAPSPRPPYPSDNTPRTLQNPPRLHTPRSATLAERRLRRSHVPPHRTADLAGGGVAVSPAHFAYTSKPSAIISVHFPVRDIRPQDLERLASGEEPPHFEPGFDLVFSLGLIYHLADPYKVLVGEDNWRLPSARTMSSLERAAITVGQPTSRRPTAAGRPSTTAREVCQIREAEPAPTRSGFTKSTWSTSFWRPAAPRVDVLCKDVQSWHQHVTILAS